MSLVTFNAVRYYVPTDVYYYSVDNRPLTDLASNDVLLQAAIDGVNSTIGNLAAQIVAANGATTAPTARRVTLLFNQPLTTASLVTGAASPNTGDTLIIVRTALATGTFNVSFSGKNLTVPGTSFTWQFDGMVWQQIAYSTLI